jgi:hypothetical protein
VEARIERYEHDRRLYRLVVRVREGGANLAPLCCLGSACGRKRAAGDLLRVTALMAAALASPCWDEFLRRMRDEKLHRRWSTARVQEFHRECHREEEKAGPAA